HLKQRKGRHGVFFGCSNYPKCKYTSNKNHYYKKPTSPSRASNLIKINASDIQSVSYCPMSFYYRQHGVEQSHKNQVSMEKGTFNHEVERYIQHKRSDSRCYLASYAFGIDHPVTVFFRGYRDEKLIHNPLGRLSMKTYYWLSPKLIFIGKYLPGFKLLSQIVINKLFKLLSTNISRNNP
ncbi:MAG: hypothetical protein HON94_16245, partial [Methylococcales bacterium]|nr:hypothetical protein [Methylococcales bacterium]